MRPGEIYLAQFPFGDIPGMKLRPVLLLTGPIGSVREVLVAYISSVIPSQLLRSLSCPGSALPPPIRVAAGPGTLHRSRPNRSEEHTSELQSRSDLVCRLLLEKKKKTAPAEQCGPGRHAATS